MFEWILAGMMCATAIVMVAHTIEEAVLCARPLRARSHRFPHSPLCKEGRAARVHPGNDEKARKRAA
jgi:ABC-type nitrate/sulfonate/bicarbonate transport system ATPase subunit